MRIRYKILLILTLIMVISFVSLYFVAQTTVLDSVAKSESTRSSSNALRFVYNLNIPIDSLDKYATDWARWDDTYIFAENNNTAYIEYNLLDNTFENLQLNMILIFDQNGMLVFGKMYDISNQSSMPVTDVIINQVTENSGIFTSSSINAKKGLILVKDASMMIASQPILTSEQQGPPHGILIMGRYLDEIELPVLSKSLGLPISIELVNDKQASEDFQLAKETLSLERPIFTHPLNETAIAGYVLLGDVEGNPLLIAKVTDYRTEYAQGSITVMYVGTTLFATMAIMFAVIAVLLDKVVVSRLSKLNDTVINIRKKGDNSKRVTVQGHDELSSLSANINSMLDVIDDHTKSLEKTVTERTKDLYQNQEKLKSIILASPDAIVATDLAGNITECNEKLCELCGLDRHLLLGKNALRFFKENPAELFEKIAPKETGSDGVVLFETEVKLNNRAKFPAEFSVNVLSDENENPVGYVAIVRDLSERKALEQRLFKSERLAAIGELAGMVGHDLRNPLTAIKNASYFLNKKCVLACENANSLQMFRIIDSSIEHANKIINDLLEYSREIHLEITKSSPKTLLHEALSAIKVPSNINLIDQTTDTQFDVDKRKVLRVFVNLLKNAFDAMPKGGTLEVKSKKKNGSVMITFSDTGVGIPVEVMQNLFTPLFTTKAQGMGFGLPISKRIVKAHGGKISVDSTDCKGTTFTLTFPAHAPEQPLLRAQIISKKEIILS